MSDFTEHLKAVFEHFGSIEAKRMFGGHGIYHDGLMFGLVADDMLYLKVDDESRASFEAIGAMPFEYAKQGKTMKMSYFSAPEAIFEDRELARRWAELAYSAALRARGAGKRKTGSALVQSRDG